MRSPDAEQPTAQPTVEPPAVMLRRFIVGFGRHHVIRNVSLTVHAGERVAILGPNGAGKTTLLRTLATLQQPLGGAAQILGAEIVSHRRETRRHIGYVGHVPHVIGHLTARENLTFLASLYDLPTSKPRIAEVLNVVGLSDLADRRTRELSRGQLQRVAIAAATVHEPEVLLLDEPDTSLDRDCARSLPSMLDKLVPSATVLLSTHDPTVAASVCGRSIMIDGGYVRELDAPRNLPPVRPEKPRHASAPFFASIWAILRKDVLVEWRAREQGPPLLAFTLLMTMLFDMAFVIPAATDAPSVAAGVAWATLVLAASLSGVRLFGSERDQSTMTRLRLTPIDQSAVFVAKYVVLIAQVLAVGLVQLAFLSILLDLQLFQWGLIATLLLVAVSLSAVTTMQSALALNTRARELLMPLLAVPLAIPVMLAGVSATLATLQGGGMANTVPWLGLLAVIAAVFLSLGIVLYPQAVET